MSAYANNGRKVAIIHSNKQTGRRKCIRCHKVNNVSARAYCLPMRGILNSSPSPANFYHLPARALSGRSSRRDYHALIKRLEGLSKSTSALSVYKNRHYYHSCTLPTLSHQFFFLSNSSASFSVNFERQQHYLPLTNNSISHNFNGYCQPEACIRVQSLA